MNPFLGHQTNATEPIRRWRTHDIWHHHGITEIAPTGHHKETLPLVHSGEVEVGQKNLKQVASKKWAREHAAIRSPSELNMDLLVKVPTQPSVSCRLMWPRGVPVS